MAEEETEDLDPAATGEPVLTARERRIVVDALRERLRDIRDGASIARPGAWREKRLQLAVELQGAIEKLASGLPAAPATYEIGRDAGGAFIACLTCSAKSYHLRDIEERYCGRCHRFHDG